MMDYRTNVKAVLETCFSGFKDELIEAAADRICSIKEKPLYMVKADGSIESINLDEVKDLSKRVETLEKQMKEDKEAQLNKLKAELNYAKYCSSVWQRMKERLNDNIFNRH